MKIAVFACIIFSSINLCGAQATQAAAAPHEPAQLASIDPLRKANLHALTLFMQTILPKDDIHPLINAYASEPAQLRIIIPAEPRLGGWADVKALSHNRFAVHRGARIQTWQLLADAKAHKEGNEYDTDPNELDVMVTGAPCFTALPDDTVLFSKSYHGDETFHCAMNHWDPRTNATERHPGQSYQTAPKILPLKSGKIVLFYPGSTVIAQSAAALSAPQPIRQQAPFVSEAQALSANDAVAVCEDAVTVYDAARWTVKTRTPIPANETVDGIAAVDDTRFLTWGAEKDASDDYLWPSTPQNPFIDLWHADGRTQKKLKRIKSNKTIRQATIMGSRCFAIGYDDILHVFDLTNGLEQTAIPCVNRFHSLAKLTDGTIVAGHGSDNSVSVVAQPTPLEEAMEDSHNAKREEEAKELHQKRMAEVAQQIIAGKALNKRKK